MPKAIKRRVKKKDTATVDVEGRLTDIKDKLREKQKSLLSYGIGALVVVLVVAGIFFYNYNTRQKANEIEYEAYKYYYNQYTKIPLSDQERYQKALDMFKQAYAVRKSPRVLMYIANSYYELGKYDEALAALNDFAKRYSSEKDLLPLAYAKTAQIELKKGNREQALKTLDTLYKAPGTVYKDTALFESAKILESEGKTEEAMAKYKEITDKFKDSPYYEDAKSKTAEKK